MHIAIRNIICIFVVGFGVGLIFLFSKVINPKIKKWQEKGHWSHWADFLSMIVTILYIWLFCHIGYYTRVVYVDQDKGVFHYDKKCSELKKDKYGTRFFFEAVDEGYYLCPECDTEEQIKIGEREQKVEDYNYGY